ncbi:MAG: hypothetical protein IKR52_04680 [Paludibacteraceae bacterium]|nr:hypothetical protein [Paludibacteraceae bacterium]
MLHQDRFICILLILIFTGCSKYVKVDQKKLTEYRKDCVSMSKKTVSDEEYNNVYNLALDSLNFFIKYHLKEYEFGNIYKWELDSVICFNKEKNKCIMSINTPDDVNEDASADYLDYFYGVKINEQWYFFPGAGVVILRERYKEDICTPMTFEQLRLLAAKYIYAGYLKENDKGDYEINNSFFSDLTSCAWYIGEKPQTQEQWDSVYIEVVGRKWRKHDQEQYEKSRQMFENMHFYTAEELDTMKIETTK